MQGISWLEHFPAEHVTLGSVPRNTHTNTHTCEHTCANTYTPHAYPRPSAFNKRLPLFGGNLSLSRSSVHHTCSLTKTDGRSLNSECLSTCTLNTQHVTQRPSEGLGVDSSAGLACRGLGTTMITHTVAGALGHTCNPLHSALRRRQPEVQSSRLPSATGHIQGRSGLWETISAAAAVKTETKTQKHQATLAWLSLCSAKLGRSRRSGVLDKQCDPKSSEIKALWTCTCSV